MLLEPNLQKEKKFIQVFIAMIKQIQEDNTMALKNNKKLKD